MSLAKITRLVVVLFLTIHISTCWYQSSGFFRIADLKSPVAPPTGPTYVPEGPSCFSQRRQQAPNNHTYTHKIVEELLAPLQPQDESPAKTLEHSHYTTTLYIARNKTKLPRAVIKATREWCLTRAKLHPNPLEVYNIVLYNGESEVLRVLLRYLAPYVNTVVIVESTTTFSGIVRPLAFPLLEDIIHSPPVNILHVVLQNVTFFLDEYDSILRLFKKEERVSFTRELALRRAGFVALKEVLHASESDLVLLGDVDEFPPLSYLARLRYCEVSEFVPVTTNGGSLSLDTLRRGPVWSLPLKQYIYNFCCTTMRGQRTDSFITAAPVSVVAERGVGWVRLCFWNPDCTPVRPGNDLYVDKGEMHQLGWHLSFFLSPQQIQGKLESYSHVTRNHPPYNTLEWISDSVQMCRHPFDLVNGYVQMDWIPPRKMNLPVPPQWTDCTGSGGLSFNEWFRSLGAPPEVQDHALYSEIKVALGKANETLRSPYHDYATRTKGYLISIINGLTDLSVAYSPNIQREFKPRIQQFSNTFRADACSSRAGALLGLRWQGVELQV